MANTERDYMKTGGLNDVELAMKFHDDFSEGKGSFIGKRITIATFNEWINEKMSMDSDFTFTDHGWATPEGSIAWAGYRSTIRTYLKNGVMDPEYALVVKEGGYAPYIVKIGIQGIDLEIVQFSDHIVDTALGLAVKRQKTIKGQTHNMKKGFDTIKKVYGVKNLSIDFQAKLLESQNDMRLKIESAFDEIYRKTIKDTADLIAASRKAIKEITEFTESANEFKQE